MIPVLYDEMAGLITPGSLPVIIADPDEVKARIPSHKIGYLKDTISCVVTEERNGLYEVLFTYPVTGSLFDEITPGRAVMVKANPSDQPQLFRIYKTSKVLRGIMTVNARHISYDLSGVPVMTNYMAPVPGTAARWLERLFYDTPFTGYSDIPTEKTPGAFGSLLSARSMMGGVEGSLLDTYGGEYKFDNYEISLLMARGQDKGVTIEYGKNLTGMTLEQDVDAAYTGVKPFARYYLNDGSEHITAGATTIATGANLGYDWVRIVDVTDMLGLDAGVVPTNAQVMTAGRTWLAQHPLGMPNPTVTITLTDADRAEGIPYQTIDLCDTVTVRYVRYGVEAKQKVVSTEYDSLLERYKQITLGKTAANLAGSVNSLEAVVAELQTNVSREMVHHLDSTTLTTGVWSSVGSFTLPPGTWIIMAIGRFAANSTGRRTINISNTSGSATSLVREMAGSATAATGGQTIVQICTPYKSSSSRPLFLNAFQNSGGDLGVDWAYSYVRLA